MGVEVEGWGRRVCGEVEEYCKRVGREVTGFG